MNSKAFNPVIVEKVKAALMQAANNQVKGPILSDSDSHVTICVDRQPKGNGHWVEIRLIISHCINSADRTAAYEVKTCVDGKPPVYAPLVPRLAEHDNDLSLLIMRVLER